MAEANQRKLYGVIQFTELPFKEIPDFICVPYTWIIACDISSPEAVVTYPNNEKPDTRDRVKKRDEPDEQWRLYLANIMYETDDYNDAENWIAMRNRDGSDKNKSEIRDTQLQPDNKLRNASQLFRSDVHSQKFQLIIERYKNSRKPLLRKSIKRPLTKKPNKNMDNKRSKSNGNAEAGNVANNAIIASGFLKKVIQIKPTKTTSNDVTDTEQIMKLIKEDQPDKMIIESTSTKPLAEQQPSPKLVVEQQSSLKLSSEQPSYNDYDSQRSPDMPIIDLDDNDEDMVRCQDDISDHFPEQRLSIEPIPIAQKPVPVNKLSIPLVSHSHFEPQLQKFSTGIPKEPNFIQKNLHQILILPSTVPKPPNGSNQLSHKSERFKSLSSPVIKSSNSKPSTQNIIERDSPSSQISMNCVPSTSHDKPNWEKISLSTPVRKKSSAVKNPQNSVNKKTRLDYITKNLSPQQEPSNSMIQLNNFTNGSAIMQNSLTTQNQLQQAQFDGSLMDYMRCNTGIEYINHNVPSFEDMINTSDSRNLIQVPHQYHTYVGSSLNQQYLPTQENSTINRRFSVPSQPNAVNQPIQILPQNANQFLPVNKAYEQKVIQLEQMKTSDFEHPTLSQIQKNILLQELGIDRRDESFIEHVNTIPAIIPKNLRVEPGAATQVTEVQSMPLADQSTSVQSNYVDQHRSIKKILVDKATETNSMMNIDQYIDEITESFMSEKQRTEKCVDSACQTYESWEEDTGLPYQETVSYPEGTPTGQGIESENKVVLEDNQTDLVNVKNVTLEDQQIKSRIAIEQEMLDMFSTLFNQMGTTLSYTRDMFNSLQNSMVGCSQTYKILLEKILKFNSLSLYLDNNTSQVSQTGQVTLSGDNSKDIRVDNAPKQRGTFSLPAEYDSNDTKWTLKYRENRPGLVELLPTFGIYVNKKELKRCIEESSDCRSLARLLLTEVFSMNALSVCSLTGGKAKAFSSVNIDVRPGLDQNARTVLLAFIEAYGYKRGWKFETSGIISSIRTKIYDIRAKYDEKCKV